MGLYPKNMCRLIFILLLVPRSVRHGRLIVVDLSFLSLPIHWWRCMHGR